MESMYLNTCVIQFNSQEIIMSALSLKKFVNSVDGKKLSITAIVYRHSAKVVSK
jgi:hypothetical protein